ncbi:MAG TPA: hypothetical protein VF269_01400 [Rhodanobacteraceae bacterium]
MKRITCLLLGGALALSLAACSKPASPTATATTPMQLKLYHVPAQQSTQLARALQRALIGGNLAGMFKQTSIRVSSPYPGTLTVYAPRATQTSVGQVITELVKSATTPMAPARLQVHFWLVNVIAGKGADTAALKPLEPTLDHLRAALGPSHFVLDEAVSATTSMAGNGWGSLKTMHGQYQHVYRFQAEAGTGGAIRLKMSFEDHSGQTIPQLQTTTILRPGHYVVLAQAPSASATGSATTLTHLLVASIDRPGTSS